MKNMKTIKNTKEAQVLRGSGGKKTPQSENGFTSCRLNLNSDWLSIVHITAL